LSDTSKPPNCMHISDRATQLKHVIEKLCDGLTSGLIATKCYKT